MFLLLKKKKIEGNYHFELTVNFALAFTYCLTGLHASEPHPSARLGGTPAPAARGSSPHLQLHTSCRHSFLPAHPAVNVSERTRCLEDDFSLGWSQICNGAMQNFTSASRSGQQRISSVVFVIDKLHPSPWLSLNRYHFISTFNLKI